MGLHFTDSFFFSRRPRKKICSKDLLHWPLVWSLFHPISTRSVWFLHVNSFTQAWEMLISKCIRRHSCCCIIRFIKKKIQPNFFKSQQQHRYFILGLTCKISFWYSDSHKICWSPTQTHKNIKIWLCQERWKCSLFIKQVIGGLVNMEYLLIFVFWENFTNFFYCTPCSPISSPCQPIWIQIRPDILSGLIWVQTACKGYQQMTLADKWVKAPLSCSSWTYSWKCVAPGANMAE